MGNAKRVFLWTLVGTLALAAALGIWVVLFGSFLGLEGEVFGTLGTLFLFALPGLMAAAMWERGHFRRTNAAALGIVGVGTLLFLAAIWLDVWGIWGGSDAYGKAMFLSAMWAWTLPWAAALGLTRFPSHSPLDGVRKASIGAVVALAGLLSLMVAFEVGEEVWQVPAVLGILVALGTVATPILYVVAGDRPRKRDVESMPGAPGLPGAGAGVELQVRCPRCLLEQRLPTGESRCGRCRLRFTIDVEEPRCPACGYLLHGLTTPRCPECGKGLEGEEVVRQSPSTAVAESRWIAPWQACDAATPEEAVAAELYREVGAGHVLAGMKVKPLGRRQDQDDMLFALQDGSGRLAVVHLTYSQKTERDARVPHTEIYSDWSHFERERMLRDAAEWRQAVA